MRTQSSRPAHPKFVRFLLGPATLAAALAGCGAAEEGSEVESIQARIVNGIVATSNTKHSAALYHMVYQVEGLPDGWRWFPRPCTANRLDVDGWYITARHCVTTNGKADGTLVWPEQLQLTEALSPGLATWEAPPAGNVAVIHVKDYSASWDVALVYAPGAGAVAQGELPGLMPMQAADVPLTNVFDCGYGQYVFDNVDANAADPQYGAGTLRCMTSKQLEGVTGSGPVETYFTQYLGGTPVYPAHGDSGSAMFVEARTYDVDASAYLGIHTRGILGPNNFSTLYATLVSPLIPWLQSHLGWFYIKRAKWASYPSESYYLDIQYSDPNWGTFLWAWDFNDSSAQHWAYDASTQAIVNENGLCLDVQWGNNADGTPVHMWGCNNTAAQKWVFTKDFHLVNIGGRCLTASTPRTTLYIDTCRAQDARQTWFLTAAP